MVVVVLDLSDSLKCFDCFGKKKKTREQPQTQQNYPYAHSNEQHYHPPNYTTIEVVPKSTISYEQQVVNRYCRQGQLKCVLENKNIEHLQNVTFPASLIELYIWRNSVRSLHNVIFPSSLRVLSLEQNKLTFGEHYIDLSYLRSLRRLVFDHNRIRSLQYVRFPRYLTELYVRGNQIETLDLYPENVYRLNNLQKLDLGLNKISTLIGNLTQRIPAHIQSLKLNMNRISSVEHVTFPRYLMRIDLSNNPLETFDVLNIKQLLADNNIHVDFHNTRINQGQLSNALLDIPTIIWKQKETSATKECQICCDQINTGDIVRILPCLHQYHCKCVDRWLGAHATCPDCRHRIDIVELP